MPKWCDKESKESLIRLKRRDWRPYYPLSLIPILKKKVLNNLKEKNLEIFILLSLNYYLWHIYINYKLINYNSKLEVLIIVNNLYI